MEKDQTILGGAGKLSVTLSKGKITLSAAGSESLLNGGVVIQSQNTITGDASIILGLLKAEVEKILPAGGKPIEDFAFSELETAINSIA